MALDDPKSLARSLPAKPGVYRMLDRGGDVLYVGKARDLRKRVQSYFRRSGLSGRIQSMMRLVADIQATVTHTENEALLLENNFIKSQQPRYNILLRDDKSYPYIFLSRDHDFPRLGFHRGPKRAKGLYFGPYPAVSAVRESLNLLQKIFPVRQCEDSFFRNRARPCLQYQIKRCSAPCVGYITADRYAQDVRHAVMFLEGRSQAVITELVKKMETAAENQNYEAAAVHRDRIAVLRHVQERQYVSGGSADADVLAVAAQAGRACIEVTFIRGGRNVGSKRFFPAAAGNSPAEILAAFLPQYYLGKAIPPRLYFNTAINDRRLIEDVFTQQSGHKVAINSAGRGRQRRWIAMAQLNARDALRRYLASQANLRQRFDALREVLALEAQPERMECFDISHTGGEAPVAACVVFDGNGPVKSDYRRFNIEGVAPGDDYGALRQALTRRYRRVKEGGGRLPDLLFIDGGKGQIGIAEKVLEELQIEGVKLIGVAKGHDRKPGRERLFLSGRQPALLLPADSPALHLIQQVRDEAHRFAITGHRQRRGKARTSSVLEEIPGVGARRRQALLRNFGGLREVTRAGVEDLARVPGISQRLAQQIYDNFHNREN